MARGKGYGRTGEKADFELSLQQVLCLGSHRSREHADPCVDVVVKLNLADVVAVSRPLAE